MFIYWSFETPDDQYLKTDWSDRALFFGKTVPTFSTGRAGSGHWNFVR